MLPERPPEFRTNELLFKLMLTPGVPAVMATAPPPLKAELYTKVLFAIMMVFIGYFLRAMYKQESEPR